MTELDPNLIGNLESQARTDGLYGTGSPGDGADRAQAEQASVIRLLRDDGPRDLIASMIQAAQVQWRKDEYYRVVGDADTTVSIPVLGDDLSQWSLDHIVTWCPQGNSTPGAIETSKTSQGPGAGGNLAALPIVTAGTYAVTVTIDLSGSGETLTENAQLSQGAVVFGTPLQTIQGQTIVTSFGQLNLAAGALNVTAIGAGAGTAFYNVTVTATPVGASNGEVLVVLGAGSGGNMFKIPAVIQASKNIQSQLIQLPVTQPEVTSLGVTGTTGDRVAVIFVYKRGGS